MAASGRATTGEARREPPLADRARKAVATKDLIRDVDRIEVDHLANGGKRRYRYRN